MSSESPAAVLFDSSGNALAVQNATPIPASTPALLVSGTDGTNSLYELLDGYGRQIIVGPAAAGSAPLGAPLFAGASVTTTAPTYATGTVNALSLTTGGLLRVDGSGTSITSNQGAPNTLANAWPVEITDGTNVLGTNANPLNVVVDGYVNIMGSITATNPSVSNTNAADPTQATFVGGSVTTTAPTYTNGTMNALSLTTSGLLRVDGSGATQPVSGTVTANQGTAAALAGAWPVEITDGTNVLGTNANPLTIDGYVGITGTITTTNNTSAPTGGAAPANTDFVGGLATTAAPTYTTNTVNPLSLTTSGALRVDASGTTQPVSGTVTSNQGTASALSGAWPVEITDGYNILGTSANPVNVTGTIVTNKASTSNVTSVAAATSNTVVLASNNARVLCSVFNNATKPMYIKLGAAATLSSFSIQLMPGSYWEPPQDWVGEIDAVWGAGVTGNALVTEMSP